MADDSDIPPLEDMSDVLKQASAIRAGGTLDTLTNEKPKTTSRSAKDRAKVKKNVAAKTVNLETVNINEAAGDHKILSTTTSVASTTSTLQTALPSSVSAKISETSSGGVFGGLKKGFLFGDTPKSSSHSNKNKSNVDPVKPVQLKEVKPEKKIVKEDMPFICGNSEKTQSSLTLNEVQQAMSEAKGLLDNQDWINDDLLNKVEKNEGLLQRFADPNFMKALGEFQTNPTAAMEKYKGNTEVEKFLVEFCSLLGDHFTNIGNTSDNIASPQTTARAQSQQSKTLSKKSGLSDKISEPKITEIVDDKLQSPKFNDTKEQNTENIAKNSKIIELTDNDTSLEKPSELHAVGTKSKETDIMVHSLNEQADIHEVPRIEDAEVRKMLNNPRVMEILLDPKVMNLIQLLKTDPAMAQRIVDTADTDLKDKVKFLVSKGLLQFQTC